MNVVARNLLHVFVIVWFLAISSPSVHAVTNLYPKLNDGPSAYKVAFISGESNRESIYKKVSEMLQIPMDSTKLNYIRSNFKVVGFDEI